MMYTLMSTFALIFYTDMGIDAVHASAIILAARIFDALNDPVMGIIVDKTKTKYGKMRPYLKWAPIPIAISFALTAAYLSSLTRLFFWSGSFFRSYK